MSLIAPWQRLVRGSGMGKIEVGQFSSLLRRYLGMRGESFVADELAPEISPIFVLEHERPEWEWLKGAKLISALLQILPVAGQTGLLRVRNPSASGAIAILDPIYFSTNAVATELIISRTIDGGSDLANLLATVGRDVRAAQTVASALVVSWTNNVAFSGTSFHRTFLAINAQQEYRAPIVLTPGFVIEFQTLALGSDLRGSINWLEKRFDDLESR